MVAVAAAAVLAIGCGGTNAPAPETAVAATPESTVAGGMSIATGGNALAPAAAPVPVAPVMREITIPAGTSLALELQSSVASDTSRIEDAVRATLRQPVIVGGREVLPAGTQVAGHVTNADDAGRVKGRASVAFRFTSLTVDGSRYDIQTSPISRRAAATKGEDATKIAIGAGAGAALGALLGGGDGAAKGAAIGGAGGTGVVLATKGKEVRLGAGADVATKLTAPVTLRVRG
jgi:hypothetical protein